MLAITLALGLSIGSATASAAGTVVIFDETSGTQCSFYNCEVHFVGEVELSARIFGFEVHEGDCLVELDLAFYTTGWGWVDSFNELEDTSGTHDSNCFHGPVATAETLPWSFGLERDAPGVIGMSMFMDLDPTESAECSGFLSVELVDNNESYVASFNRATLGPICELTGDLAMESPGAIHINHL